MKTNFERQLERINSKDQWWASEEKSDDKIRVWEYKERERERERTREKEEREKQIKMRMWLFILAMTFYLIRQSICESIQIIVIM